MAQTPPLPSDPVALLQLASEANGLHGSELRPWHVRATWQTLDEKKQVTNQGTWDEWWAGDKKYKIVVSSKGDQQTLWGTDHGVFAVVTGKSSPEMAGLLSDADALPSADFDALPDDIHAAGFLIERLLNQPVPELTPAGLAQMRLQESRKEEGGTTLVCALQAFILPDGNPHVSPDKSGRFLPSINRYCFDESAPVLRIESAPGQVITFNSLVRFQNRYLARAIHIAHTAVQTYIVNDPTLSRTKRTFSPVAEGDINIDVAEPLSEANEIGFTPPGTAIPVPAIRASAINQGIMAGERISGVLASYPREAREWHIQGTVAVHATILKDGSVGDLRVISGPQTLLQPVLNSIKTWQYEPYLVGGQPVRVVSQIHMTFSYN